MNPRSLTPRSAPRLLLLAGGIALLSGCSAQAITGHGVATSAAVPATVSTPSLPPVAKVSVTPGDQTRAVPLSQQVKVASDGTLQSVDVAPTTDTGAPLPGSMDQQSHTWTSMTPLQPSTTYVVRATAHGLTGDTTTQATFTTVDAYRLTTTPFPTDGQTVGIGMPIKLLFNVGVTAANQANLVSHLHVTTSPTQVQGAWRWFAPNEVHYRPATYWPEGTHVTLTADLDGVAAGNGYWGLGNWSESFTIGQQHVIYISATTDRMIVTADGKVVWNWPVSLGMPTRPTLSGTLVIWYHQYDVLMDSMTLYPPIPRNAPGGYYEHVYWDTAISTDGFFIHSAPWSEWAQGSQNVSHGCVNLSPDRAQTFFGWSQAGDVVVVTGTNRPATGDDGEGDWQIPFYQYANSQGGVTSSSTTSNNPGGA